MKWLGGRESSNVEDRRGISGGHVAAGGGVIGLIIYLIYAFIGGGDGGQQMPQLPGQTQAVPQTQEQKAADDQLAKFAKVVLADTEDVWTKLFSDQGKTYQDPTLVLFSDQVSSACGTARTAWPCGTC